MGSWRDHSVVRDIKWEPRRLASRLVRALVFVVPLLVGVAVATIVARLLPGFDTWPGGVFWWVAVLGSSFVAVNVTDRFTRRFLPLAALLDMSLVFPGAAPSRVKVAMRTWTTGQLQRRIHEARDRGIDDDPTRAGETVLLLVAALNAHDRVTRGHAERTRAYTDLLAEELGVPEELREKLRWVSLLHDVGKLKIAGSVLNKAGTLDVREWEVIKKHPRFGDELLTPIKDFLEPWADTVLHHHERWDGTGYPQGLSGEQINYGARIVAVADAFDAMTASRSYQPARSPRDALRELSHNAGSQFDPIVVRAFLDISARRLRRLTGPLAILAQVPFVAGLQRAAEWAGTATAGTAMVAAAVATGVVVPVPTVAPIVVPVAVATTTTAAMHVSVDSVLSETTVTNPPSTLSTTTTTEPAPSTTSQPASSTTTTSTTTTSTTTTSTTTSTTAAPANKPPIATDDSVSGNADRTFPIAVLANDSDPDGDSLALVSCSTSAQGAQVTLEGDTCKYRHPDPGSWAEPDTFTYTISDGNGATATATVTVTPS